MLLTTMQTMNRRFICVLALALAAAPTLAACGGDDESETQAAAPTLSGVYRPVGEGPIGSITFTGSKDYLLMPSGCAGGACAEIGTYSLDSAGRALVLENAVTHRTRTIALEIVKTSTPSASLVKSVKPLDLVEPGQQLNRPGGGQQLNNGSGNELASPGGGITGAVSQLLQVILEAIMNGQQMQRDKEEEKKEEAEKKKEEEKKDDKPINPLDCKQGVPTAASTPAQALAYFARCPGGP